MAQMPESKGSSIPNMQDAFLNFVRRERHLVHIRLMDGGDIEAHIKHFDRFAIVIEQDGTDALVFKHAIASITAPKSQQNYFNAPHA